MVSNIYYRSIILSALLVTLVLCLPNRASGHCDGMDGPVVKAAQKALETGDTNPVLIWVQNKNEAEIEKAFQKTLAVRNLSPQAKEFADMYFFEALVRIHRAGEGAPYTGLKPAGRDLGPAIPAADKAIESGKVEPLLKLLTDAVQSGSRKQFKEVTAKKKFTIVKISMPGGNTSKLTWSLFITLSVCTTPHEIPLRAIFSSLRKPRDTPISEVALTSTRECKINQYIPPKGCRSDT